MDEVSSQGLYQTLVKARGTARLSPKAEFKNGVDQSASEAGQRVNSACIGTRPSNKGAWLATDRCMCSRNNFTRLVRRKSR